MEPGYVYALSHPRLPGLIKVGHTYRPPHRRAKSLGKTALPSAFDVQFARFFWQSRRAEQSIHRILAAHYLKTREFFEAPLDVVLHAIETLTPPPLPFQTSISNFTMEDPWEHPAWNKIMDAEMGTSREELEEQWAWAEERLRIADPKERKKGWQEMERMSAMGWGDASVRLAERMLMGAMSPDVAWRASWILDAAEVQGISGAAFRAQWLRSFQPQGWNTWTEALQHALKNWGDSTLARWPELAKTTMETELKHCCEQEGRHQWMQTHCTSLLQQFKKTNDIEKTGVL